MGEAKILGKEKHSYKDTKTGKYSEGDENIDNCILTAQKWTYQENGGMNQEAWASRSFFSMHVSRCLR